MNQFIEPSLVGWPVAGELTELCDFLHEAIEHSVVPERDRAASYVAAQLSSGVPRDDADYDPILRAEAKERALTIACFLFGFAFFEARTVEVAVRKGMSKQKDTIAEAIAFLDRTMGPPACGTDRLKLIAALRNRVAHDGGGFTKRLRKEAAPLVASGEIRKFMFDDVVFDEDFVSRAFKDLVDAYAHWTP